MCTVHYQKLNGWGKTNPQMVVALNFRVFLCGPLRISAFSTVKGYFKQRPQRYAEDRREKTGICGLLFVGVGFTETKVRQFTERRHASARF